MVVMRVLLGVSMVGAVIQYHRTLLMKLVLQAGIYPGLALLIPSWYRRGKAITGGESDLEVLTKDRGAAT